MFHEILLIMCLFCELFYIQYFARYSSANILIVNPITVDLFHRLVENNPVIYLGSFAETVTPHHMLPTYSYLQSTKLGLYLEHSSSRKLVALAKTADIRMTPLSFTWWARPQINDPAFIVRFGGIAEDWIDEGIQRLKEAWFPSGGMLP